MMTNRSKDKVNRLLEKGVTIPAPESVEIGEDLNIDRISGDGVVLHNGTKLFGSSTYISKNCIIGREGPATIDNCWLAPEVTLKSGYFNKAVFLKKASLGFGSHVREGTILEEEASTAHTVGLKQTILFPFVTLGSLINFCDCFMSGGTSRKDHSEVGSSYIHFNYTPNQDKATASLIGDVPNGVMLNNKPIFLGGQGGLVGPCMFSYGTVIAAGTLQRNDEMRPDRLIFGGSLKAGSIKNTRGNYPNIKRILSHNVMYIANLIALYNWYKQVRSRFISSEFPEELLEGLTLTLNMAIDERIKRLTGVREKLTDSLQALKEKGNNTSRLFYQQRDICDNWNRFSEKLAEFRAPDDLIGGYKKEHFLYQLDSILLQKSDKDYISTIKELDTNVSASGTGWLHEIVNTVHSGLMQLFPSISET